MARIVTFPFRLLMALTKATLATLCVLLLIASLALPVLTTVSQVPFTIAATVAEWVTSMPNLLKRQERKAATVIAEKEALVASERAAKKAAQTAAADLGVKLDKSVAKVAAAERKAAELAANLAKKEAALAEMAAAKVIYRGEQRAMKEVVADAAQRVGARTTKIIKADIAGMVGQSIPYAGAVAVVAVTAYDLDQSCELMKELHELDVAFNPDHAIDEREVCGMQVPTVDEVLAQLESAPGAAVDAIVATFPDFYWKEGMEDLERRFPKFYWREGWNDLVSKFSDGSP